MKTLEDFRKEVLDFLKEKPKNWRDGQAVFNYIDSMYGVSRTLQFKYGIDCFYNDNNIDVFIDKAYELLTE